MNSLGGRPITDTSNTDAIKYFYISINFLNSWLKSIYNNFIWSCQAYSKNTDKLFRKIPTTITVNTYQYFKQKCQLLPTHIGEKWYMDILNTNYLQLKGRLWSKSIMEIMIKLRMTQPKQSDIGMIENYRSTGKIRMGCSKETWSQKEPFFYSTYNFLNNLLGFNWVGHSLMKPKAT